MAKTIAVLISDIHFTPNTLELASAALLKAQYEAARLKVPLVICGDTLDTKCIIRAECANKLLQMLSVKDAPKTYMLVGNHDLCNEKGTEHALNFLWGFCEVIASPTQVSLMGKEVLLVPYYSNVELLQPILDDPETPRTLIMHQGVQGAYMGHYVQDKTSLPPEAFAEFRVISGHYHRAQDIKCGRPRKGAIGLFSYVGNPYTLSFAEANDGPKGYQLLGSDGLLTQVPLDLRKHIIYDCRVEELGGYGYATRPRTSPSDLVWFKLRGPKSELAKINKAVLGDNMLGHTNFKLDLIADASDEDIKVQQDLPDSELLDQIIDNLSETEEQKQYLRDLWREVLDEAA